MRCSASFSFKVMVVVDDVSISYSLQGDVPESNFGCHFSPDLSHCRLLVKLRAALIMFAAGAVPVDASARSPGV